MRKARFAALLLALLALAGSAYADTFLPVVADTSPELLADCRPTVAGFVDVWPEASGRFADLHEWPVQHCSTDPVVIITAYGLSAPVGLETLSARGVASGFVVEGRVDMSTHTAGEPLRLQYLAVAPTK